MAISLDNFRSALITRVRTVINLQSKKRELDTILSQRQTPEIIEELKEIIGKDGLLRKAESSDEISLRMYAGRLKESFIYISSHISDIEQKIINELSSAGIDIYTVITKIRKFAKVGETLIGQLSDVLIEEAETLKRKEISSYLEADLPLEEKYIEQMISFSSTLNEEIEPVLMPVSEYVVKLQYDKSKSGADVINIMITCAVFTALIATYAQNTTIFERTMQMLGSKEIRDYLDKNPRCKQIQGTINVVI